MKEDTSWLGKRKKEEPSQEDGPGVEKERSEAKKRHARLGQRKKEEAQPGYSAQGSRKRGRRS